MLRLLACLVLSAALGLAHGQGSPHQLETSVLSEQAQRALFPVTGSSEPFALSINTLTGPKRVENAAVLQLVGDKGAFPVLSTLPRQGMAVLITALKPCGMTLPHVHMRASEQYLVISGLMTAGLAEENGGRQNVTFNVGPGQSMLVPQDLLHYNANQQCSPVVMVQLLNSADSGTVGIVGAFANLNAVDPESLATSGQSNITAPPLGNFALDSACLQRCNLPPAGGDLSHLSLELKQFLGIASLAPGAAPPANAPPAPGTPGGAPPGSAPGGAPPGSSPGGAPPTNTPPAPGTPGNTIPPPPGSPGFPLHPCFCEPISNGATACFDFNTATSDINCAPPASYTCTVIQSRAGQYTQQPGPVFQCTVAATSG